MGYPSSKRVSGKIRSGQSVWGSFSTVSETSKRKGLRVPGADRHTGGRKYGRHVGGEATRSGRGKRRPGLEQTEDNRQGVVCPIGRPVL